MTSNLREKLKNKGYRDAFVGSQITIAIPFQIRALREQRAWTQAQLAEKADMLQPRISAMERPGGSKFNLDTLRRLASAFDVALVVRFVPFSELAAWAEQFSPDTFIVPSFDDDPGFHEREAAFVKTKTGAAVKNILANTHQPSDHLGGPLFLYGAGQQQSIQREEGHRTIICITDILEELTKTPSTQGAVQERQREPREHSLQSVLRRPHDGALSQVA